MAGHREYDCELEVDKTQTTRRVVMLNNNRVKSLVAYWDVAPGRPGGDDSILAIAATDEGDNTYIHRVLKLPQISDAEGEQGGWRPQTSAIMQACSDLGVNQLYVEVNRDATIVKELKDAGNAIGVRLAITGVNSTTNKQRRISEALAWRIASGRFYCHSSVMRPAQNGDPSLFMQQAEDFPACVSNHHDKDDAIDAVAGAVAQLQHSAGRFNLGSTSKISGIRNQPETHRVIQSPRLSSTGSPRQWW